MLLPATGAIYTDGETWSSAGVTGANCGSRFPALNRFPQCGFHRRQRTMCRSAPGDRAMRSNRPGARADVPVAGAIAMRRCMKIAMLMRSRWRCQRRRSAQLMLQSFNGTTEHAGRRDLQFRKRDRRQRPRRRFPRRQHRQFGGRDRHADAERRRIQHPRGEWHVALHRGAGEFSGFTVRFSAGPPAAYSAGLLVEASACCCWRILLPGRR